MLNLGHSSQLLINGLVPVWKQCMYIHVTTLQ